MFRLLSVLALISSSAHADPLSISITPTKVDYDKAEMYCLAQQIYYEAGNQDLEGMQAVGNVTMNRVASKAFPNTICKVARQGPRDGSAITKYRCQFTWWCDGKGDDPTVSKNPDEQRSWNNAQMVAEMILLDEVEDLTDGSDHYHADYVDPYWNDIFTFRKTIGTHLFYASL